MVLLVPGPPFQDPCTKYTGEVGDVLLHQIVQLAGHTAYATLEFAGLKISYVISRIGQLSWWLLLG